jgi:hypothetical protein
MFNTNSIFNFFIIEYSQKFIFIFIILNLKYKNIKILVESVNLI